MKNLINKYTLLVLMLMGIMVACDLNEDDFVPEEEIQASFEAIKESDTVWRFRNTSPDLAPNGTAGVDTAFWTFGTMLTTRDSADWVIVTYQQSDSIEIEHNVELVVVTEDEIGVSAVSRLIVIPINEGPVVVVPDAIAAIPTPDACTQTFAQNPDCFCQDPANAGDAQCALLNENGNFDDDLTAMTQQVQGGTDAEATFVIEELADGNKAVKIDIIANGSLEAGNQWQIQLINEASAPEGVVVPAGKEFLFSADIYASADGMVAQMAPGKSKNAAGEGNNFGDLIGTERFTLSEGWNHVFVRVSHNPETDFETEIRPGIQFNYGENLGEFFVVDNIKLITIGDRPEPIGVIPTPEACTETFEANPDCFCQDPANAGDANCAVLNANGTFDDDLMNMTQQVQDGTPADATFAIQELEDGNKVARVDIIAAGSLESGNQWQIQIVNEASEPNGVIVPAGKEFLYTADVYASADGMIAQMAPGHSKDAMGGSSFGDLNGAAPFTLTRGWNHLAIRVTHDPARHLETEIRPGIQLNFAENVGNFVLIDNIELSVIGDRP